MNEYITRYLALDMTVINYITIFKEINDYVSTLYYWRRNYEYRKTAAKCEADSGSVRRQTVKSLLWTKLTMSRIIVKMKKIVGYALVLVYP